MKGEGRYGKEIDCWSIGVILFILLSGSPPFEVTASFDAVANAEIKFDEEQWKDISVEAMDLVQKLLLKDPATRMSVKDACDHDWVLKEDGDTHCHPLSDPLITKMANVKQDTSEQPNVDEEDTANLDEEILSKVDSQSESLTSTTLETTCTNSEAQKADEPVQSKPVQDNDRSVDQCAELSSNECAEHQSTTAAPQHKSNATKPEFNASNQKENHVNRLHSILPCGEVTNAISQAIDISLRSPNPGSPIHRKKLFDRDAAGPETVRKLSKANVESIKTAGETLPKPVLQTAVKKKPKKEKGIHSYFAPAALKGKQPDRKASKESDSKPIAVQNKRKHETETSTTQPVGEQLVFNLNKRVKMDAKKRRSDASALSRESEPPVSKAELSEDELLSDFSDAETMDEPSNGSKQTQQMPPGKTTLTEQLAKNKVTNMFKSSNAKTESRKIQSCLFGKTPLDTKVTQSDDQEDLIDNIENSNEQTADPKTGNSSPKPKGAGAKGNKSIKSYFLPKIKK